ncbi:MAG TPA: hypothetical protein VJH04_03220 [archaeon]|nr:hypothetical protein [archaeon]
MQAEKSLVVPSKWLKIRVPRTYQRLCNGSEFAVPKAYTFEVAADYPLDETGNVFSGLKHAEVPEFLREYNEANNTDFECPTLLQDEAIRDQVARHHSIFDRNFERKNMPYAPGYLADLNRPYGREQEGIGQILVTREIMYRLSTGDVIVGATTIAPSGMVPRLSRIQWEKMIRAKGLKKLEKLRGRDIYEQGSQIVDVRNALGYPQVTLDHNATDNSGLIPHSHHVYIPGQSEPERVGLRGTYWHHGDHRCFGVNLHADCSLSDRSLPLVRGVHRRRRIIVSRTF